MNAVWRSLTLSNFSPSPWLRASLLYRTVGLLSPWRSQSWLLQWGEAIAALLIALVFGLGPFVSTSLIGVLLIACALFWGLLTLSEKLTDPVRFTSGWTPIHFVVGVYWSLSTLSVALSPVKKAAFSGWTKLTLYLLVFVLMARVLRSPRLRNWLIGLYLHIALLVSAYGIRQQLYGAEQLATWNDPTSPLADQIRVYSFLGNPNLLAAYLLPAIALSGAAIFVWRGREPKALAVLMTVLNVACLYFTGSRGAWLGLVSMVVVFLLLVYVWCRDWLSPFWQAWLLPMAAVGLGASLFLAVVLFEPLRLRVTSIFSGRDDSSNNFRINVWQAVLRMIRDRPLSGIGPGNVAFNAVYPLYMKPKFSALSAYSIFLEIAVETGLFGILTFLWLLLVVLNQGWVQLQRLHQQDRIEGFWLIGAIASVMGFLGQGLFDTVWYRPQVNTLWWLTIALVASYFVPSKHSEGLDASG